MKDICVHERDGATLASCLGVATGQLIKVKEVMVLEQIAKELFRIAFLY